MRSDILPMTLGARATEVFRALADGTRRKILELLRDGERSVGDLAAHFELSQPSIPHHPTVLRHAGLVTDQRRGKHVYYAIERSCLAEALADLMAATGIGRGKPNRRGRHPTKETKR